MDDAVEVYRRLHAFDGWDTVNLTMKQLGKVQDYCRTLYQETGEFIVQLTNVALDRMCFCLYDERTKIHSLYYFTVWADDGLIVRCESLEKPGCVRFAIKFTKEPDGDLDAELLDYDESCSEWLHNLLQDESGETEVERWEWIMDTFFGLNTFMLHYSDVSMDVVEKECKQPSERKDRKQRERNSVRFFKCYTLKKGWSSAVKRRQTEIRCLAWGVRGHFRHYRNGKTVFIKPYVKGKERDKYEGKAYELVPYSEA